LKKGVRPPLTVGITGMDLNIAVAAAQLLKVAVLAGFMSMK
jgi:hypothetical protein